ncbi:hypothetical protein LG198_05010 [Methylobacillus arboreus]|uniref:hypothetical protein n=1 Tax=Methylobacillus arboreus TaxID=755170 RepID=UPI001E5CE952|nr:hypothetical protein [Methylobacillus arboreus]MCB5190082.1 hypothetical protein [Methylobacillus arboreus]
MFDRLILCATNDKLIAGRWQFGRLRNYDVFINDAQGHAGFADFLLRYSFVPIYLMVDAQEEDFHVETLPHTIGRTRHEMLQRKLNHVYRGSTFRAAQFLTRERDKRRDDRFLFVALTNTDFLQPWLEAMVAQQAQLAGVYTLPMVSQRLLKKIKLNAGDILLSEQLSSGLRQSYLHQGRLRISRQVQIPAEAYDKLAYFHLVETDKARLYLLSQRLIARDTALKVVVLTPSDDAEHIARNIQQEQGLECQAINLAQVASHVGLPPDHVRLFPELLHMHMLARGNVPDNLAPEPITRHYKLEFLRKSLVGSALVIALLGLLLTVLYLVQAMGEAQKIEQLVVETRQQEQRYGEVANNFPATPINGMDLQTAAGIHEAIRQHETNPGKMMQVVSSVLNQLPGIQLERLRWVMSPNLALGDTESEGATAAPTQAASGGTLYQIGFVSGEIRGFAGDYRAALEIVQHFSEVLKADASVMEVVILQQPVNVSSYSSLQGSTTDERTAQREKAVFKLKLVLKPEAS